jgi:hypothetical protein
MSSPTEHGFVNWPTPTQSDAIVSTKEGGLTAYAVWWKNPNEVCIPNASCYVDGEYTIPPDRTPHAFRPVHFEIGERPERLPKAVPYKPDKQKATSFNAWMFAAKGFLYLGSTTTPLLVNEKGEDVHHFQVGTENLTPQGQEIVQTLNSHYGTSADFLTFIDT